MIVLILSIIVISVLVSWLTAPSRCKSSADECFTKGDIAKAEEHLKKVWNRRADIPAHLAGMYFELIKKGNLKYVQTSLSIQCDGLSDEAKNNLNNVQNKIVSFVENKATSAFKAYNYTEAIRYNETLLQYNEKYKRKDEEYRIYRELENYLKNGRKSPTLNNYIENSSTFVIKCIIQRVKELSSSHDILKLLSIMLSNDEIKAQFNQALLSHVLYFKEIPELRAEAEKYSLTFLEEYADKMPEFETLDAICLYKAVNQKKAKREIFEKIELLNYKRAIAYINNGSPNYSSFRKLYLDFVANTDVSLSFKYDLECKYNDCLFNFLTGVLKETPLKGKQLEDYLKCCADWAASHRADELLEIANLLHNLNRFEESNKICRLLNNNDNSVFDLVCRNVISILTTSTKCSTLSDAYDKVTLLPRIADKCFEHAKKLGDERDLAKATYIYKISEPYFSGNDKFDVFISHYLSYVMTFEESLLAMQLDDALTYLKKVTNPEIINKHILFLEAEAKELLKNKKEEIAYTISRRIFDKSTNASRIFLDSALAMAKKGKLRDSYGISIAISMQEDILEETCKFLDYFPGELRYPYIVGYARKVSDLLKINEESGLAFFYKVDDLSLREEILVEIDKSDSNLFRIIAIDILNDKNKKLPKRTHYADTVADLIIKSIANDERILFLKDLILSGYQYNELYVNAVLSQCSNTTSSDEKLALLNEALSIVDDVRFYEAKRDVALSLIESAPIHSLTICEEIKAKINAIDVQLRAYITLAETSDCLTQKHEYLRLAKANCESSTQEAYARIITIALSLASSLFVIGKNNEACSVYEEFPSRETELALLKFKFEEAKVIPGDATATKELKVLISRCESSQYLLSTTAVELYNGLWLEYVNRNISKSEKQNSEKAIESLAVTAKEVEKAWSKTNYLYKRIADRISELSYELGHEYEENATFEKALKYYDLSISYGSSIKDIQGRRVVCLLKLGSIQLSELKQEVNNVLKSVSRKVEKDIVYRFVLRLLSDGEIIEATQLAEERLKDSKLLQLCESYKVRKVQSQINELNEQLILVRDKKVDYNTAKALYDTLDSKFEPIVALFPEYHHLTTDIKKQVLHYMLKIAQKEERYDILYQYYRNGLTDFIKDNKCFRNLASASIGLIDQGSLKDSNYKEVISIWLTAVYNDYLIIRSLDQTKWDDGYTFTLDDSLSQTYDYNELPENVNFDSPGDSTISIGQVQKSLLERSEAALSNGPKKYYDFYLEQKKAMDEYSAVKFKELSPEDTTENIIAPYAINNLLPGEYKTRMNESLQTGNKEYGYQVGYLYGFKDDVYTNYGKAIKYCDACLSSARSLSESEIDTAFAKTKITAIRKFSSIFTRLNTEIVSVLDYHINEGKTYKQLSGPYSTICRNLNNDTLSYKYTEYINHQIIPLVNNDTVSTKDGLEILYETYKIYRQSHTLKKNISGMLVSLVGDYLLESSTSGYAMITRIISDTQDFNDDVLEFLSQEYVKVAIVVSGKESRVNNILNLIRNNDSSKVSKIRSIEQSISKTKLQKQLGEIIDKVNDKSMSDKTALEKVYALYRQDKFDDRICENLAIIINRCIQEYLPSNKSGYIGVKTLLDQIYNDRSIMFKAKRHIFAKALSDIKRGMSIEQQKLLGIYERDSDSLIIRIERPVYGTLTPEGERLKVALGYIKKFAE